MATVTIVTGSASERPSWTTSATTWGELGSEISERGYNLNNYNAIWHRPGRGNIKMDDTNITFDGEENIIIMLGSKKVKSGMSYVELSLGQLRTICFKRGIQFETDDTKETLNARLMSYDTTYEIDSTNPYSAFVTAADKSFVKGGVSTTVRATDSLQEAFNGAIGSDNYPLAGEEEEQDDLQAAFDSMEFDD